MAAPGLGKGQDPALLAPARGTEATEEARLDLTLQGRENGLKAPSSETGLKMASIDAEDQQFAVTRMVSVPLVTSLYELAPAAFTRDSSTEVTPQLAEKEAAPDSSASAHPALPRSQPERQFEAEPALETRSNRLDKGELPAPLQPPQQVETETTKPLPSKETEAREAGGAKSPGTSSSPRVGRANNPSHPPVGGSTRSAITSSLRSLMSSKVGQLFLRSVDRALDKSEELMNRYLPLTEKELAALTMEGLEASAVAHRKKGCLVRLGSLSTSLRNRAFMLILNKLRRTRQNTHENLSQLHQTIDLIEHIQQEKQLRGSQEKLHSMWERWSQKQEGGHQSVPGGSKDSPTTASSSKASSSTQLEVESKTLEMSRSLTQQLKSTYLNLLPNIRGLPAHLQEKMQRGHENMAELHGYFSSASSFQDLSSSVLNQSRQKVAKAWETLDEVVEFLLQNPPVTWLVESLVSLEGELLETEEKPDILKVLQHYDPQDCNED